MPVGLWGAGATVGSLLTVPERVGWEEEGPGSRPGLLFMFTVGLGNVRRGLPVPAALWCCCKYLAESSGHGDRSWPAHLSYSSQSL